MLVLDRSLKEHVCTSMDKRWFWQFSVNFPNNRLIVYNFMKWNITYVVSASQFAIAICIVYPDSSSDDKNPSILKNQTKVKNISFELFPFLPSFRINVKYKTSKASS